MSLETFDFDIIALIIAIFCVVFGAYYGLKRELKKSINFLVPLLIVHFFIKPIIEFSYSNEFISSILIVIYKFLRGLGVEPYYELYFALIIGGLVFAVLYLIIKIELSFIKSEPEKEILQKISRTSRIWGAVISLIKGYFITILTYFLCVNMFIINYESGISKVIVRTSSGISYLTSLTEVQNSAYEFYLVNDEIDVVSGRHAIEFYEKLVKTPKSESFNGIFISSLEQEASSYGYYELLNKYVEFVENNATDKLKASNDVNNLKKFLKYIKVLMESYEIEFSENDISEYSAVIYHDVYHNVDNFVSKTLRVLEKEDFENLFEVFKDYTDNKDFYLETEEHLAYKYVLNRNPKISKVSKIKEKNIFVSNYLDSCLRSDKLKGHDFAVYVTK